MRATADGIAFPADIAVDIGTEPTCEGVPLRLRHSGRRPSVACCLLVGEGKLDQLGIRVGAPEKRDASREIVPREARRDDNRRHEDQKCIDVRSALLIDEGRIHAVLDQGRLMLDRLVNNGVEPMIRHDLQHIDHQRVARPQIVELPLGGTVRKPSAANAVGDIGEQR